MAHIHIGFDLPLRDIRYFVRWINMQKGQDSAGNPVYHNHNRGKNKHQSPDNRGIHIGYLFILQTSPGFGDDLTKDQNADSQNTGCDTNRIVSKYPDGKGCCQCGGRNINNIIPHQNGTKHSAVPG